MFLYTGQDMNKLFCLLQVKDEELWDDLVNNIFFAVNELKIGLLQTSYLRF